jgi:hypothetical protein
MRSALLTTGLAVCLALPAGADESPTIEHQPSSCTVAGKPFTLCSRVSDDVQVARVTLYFRRAGETFFSFVVASFDGINFCATLPAPRDGRAGNIEYYVQAVDSSFQTQRGSTFLLQVQTAEQCSFAPVESDPQKAAQLVVYATNQKQKKLPEGFVESGVKFVPLGAKK